MAPQTTRSIGLALSLLLFAAAPGQADLTIMPLGASTTYGGASGLNIVPGGYRTRLYTDLQNAGLSFTFVGTVTENASSVLTQAGQTHHEGHPGYRIDQIANNLDGNDGSGGNNGGYWFHKPTPPDIILLDSDHNDIFQYFQTATLAQRLDALVGQIVADAPTSILFISNVTPTKVYTPLQNQLLNDLNMQIRDVIVPKYASLGANVIFVDQYANFVDANGNFIHIDSDGIHPDQIGYDLMGDTWAAAVQQALSLHQVRYTTLDVPGSIFTEARGINDLGQIVGSYSDAAGNHGFLLDNGNYTMLDVPGSTSTYASGINASGQIVGIYEDAAGAHGFLLDQGSYTTLDVPGSTATFAYGINALGQIVGSYQDATGTHGFLLDHGSYTTLDVLFYTLAKGINDLDQIVGYYYDSTGDYGFLLDNGSYTTLDVPNSIVTDASGINASGQIVGSYGDAGGTHGFLLDHGNYTTLDVPGSTDTYARGINASGQIVGSYGAAGTHGFLATPVP